MKAVAAVWVCVLAFLIYYAASRPYPGASIVDLVAVSLILAVLSLIGIYLAWIAWSEG